MNTDIGSPMKRERVGGFSIVDSDGALSYQFDGKAHELGVAVRELGELGAAMRRYRMLMGLLVIVLGIAAWSATGYAERVSQRAYDGALSMTLLGVIFVLIAYIFNKCVSKARSVNPNKEIRETSWGMAFMAALFLGIPLFADFTMFFEPVVKAKQQVWITEDLEGALISVGISVLWIAVLCAALSFRRLSRSFPQQAEIYFYERILGHLVRDLSPRARCQVTLNPLPVLWSTRFGTASSGKVAKFDLLLFARIRMGPARRVSLRVLHRRTQRGRRKNKGSKHKVKVSVRVTDPRLQQSSEGTRKKVVTEALSSLGSGMEVQKKERYSFKAKPDSLLKVTNLDGSVGWVETYLNPNAWREKLSPRDMPSPRAMLERIREVFLALDQLPASPHAPGSDESGSTGVGTGS